MEERRRYWIPSRRFEEVIEKEEPPTLYCVASYVSYYPYRETVRVYKYEKNKKPEDIQEVIYTSYAGEGVAVDIARSYPLAWSFNPSSSRTGFSSYITVWDQWRVWGGTSDIYYMDVYNYRVIDENGNLMSRPALIDNSGPFVVSDGVRWMLNPRIARYDERANNTKIWFRGKYVCDLTPVTVYDGLNTAELWKREIGEGIGTKIGSLGGVMCNPNPYYYKYLSGVGEGYGGHGILTPENIYALGTTWRGTWRDYGVEVDYQLLDYFLIDLSNRRVSLFEFLDNRIKTSRDSRIGPHAYAYIGDRGFVYVIMSNWFIPNLDVVTHGPIIAIKDMTVVHVVNEYIRDVRGRYGQNIHFRLHYYIGDGVFMINCYSSNGEFWVLVDAKKSNSWKAYFDYEEMRKESGPYRLQARYFLRLLELDRRVAGGARNVYFQPILQKSKLADVRRGYP